MYVQYVLATMTNSICLTLMQAKTKDEKLTISFLNVWYLTLKEPGFLDPSHSRGPGDSASKISKTDWRNMKCVVLVDSYDPPESIGTKKKVQKYLVWRHSDIISDVMSKTRKSPKIVKIMVFRHFFKQKLHFFGNDVCQSMFTHVLTPNKPNILDKT